MSIEIITGNIFTSQAQTLVNTVNCFGVMGKGLALEFRLRYPIMYERYVELCRLKKFEIGKLWIYKTPQRWVLNFPTKDDWRKDSKIEYLELGLEKFIATYKDKGITSIAFPILGSRNGGIAEDISLEIMEKYLKQCKIPVQCYKYDPEAEDDIFPILKRRFGYVSFEKLNKDYKLTSDKINLLQLALENPQIRSLGKLANVKGIGLKTLVKLMVITDLQIPNKRSLDHYPGFVG